MDGRNSRKAPKVPRVQSKQVRDVVYAHHGGQACIMDLNPGDSTLHHKAAPLSVGRLGLRQKKKLLFDEPKTPVSLAGGET
jgi:hypothetical protein